MTDTPGNSGTVGLAPSVRIDDFRWLIGEAATPWLALASRGDLPLGALVNTLRKHLSPGRAHLVLEQGELRRRAVTKFDKAPEMFFTRRGLEQATDQKISAYKARRYPQDGTIADLCCGIGGDLLGLAARSEVIAVDVDPVAGLVAEVNLRVHHRSRVELRTMDVSRFPVGEVVAWHLDPDRRPDGRRTTRVDLHIPGPDLVDRMLEQSPSGAVKLAPATAALPSHWCEAAEREWIGHRRECQQLVLWFGSLARRPGQAVATVLMPGSEQARRISGQQDSEIDQIREPQRYVFEAHPAVRAARLAGALASQHQLSALTADQSYLTGDDCVRDAALAAFEITDVLPMDLKRVRSVIRRRRIGRLEVKTRGVSLNPDTVRRQLRTEGSGEAALLLARTENRTLALLGRRVD